MIYVSLSVLLQSGGQQHPSVTLISSTFASFLKVLVSTYRGSPGRVLSLFSQNLLLNNFRPRDDNLLPTEYHRFYHGYEYSQPVGRAQVYFLLRIGHTIRKRRLAILPLAFACFWNESLLNMVIPKYLTNDQNLKHPIRTKFYRSVLLLKRIASVFGWLI